MTTAPDERFIDVLASNELAPGQLREVSVKGRRLVLGRLRSGEVVAFGPLCPHEAAPLAEGNIRGEAIDCPLHHYLFDLHTGENLYPLPIYPAWKRAQVGDLRLPIFPVIEREGRIAVDPRPVRPAGNSEREQGAAD
jgi:nitrite reductase/ring-hydroxylating ferredoxin subunit